MGVSLVTFSVDGAIIGTSPGQNPSVQYQVPADTPIDTTILFRAEAEDFSGNRAGDETESMVKTITEADTTPPSPPSNVRVVK